MRFIQPMSQLGRLVFGKGRQGVLVGQRNLKKEPRPTVGDLDSTPLAWISLSAKRRAELVIEPCRDEIDVLVDAIAAGCWEEHAAALHEQMVILNASRPTRREADFDPCAQRTTPTHIVVPGNPGSGSH